MFFKKRENICLITKGVDHVGRPIIKIEQEQSTVRKQTGEYAADPVKRYPSITESIPDDKALADSGWFHPTKAFDDALTNYELGNMYGQDGKIRPCFTSIHSAFETLSPDKGRLGFSLASVEERKDGSIALVCSNAVKALEVNPNAQDAATKLAKEVTAKPDDLTLGIATVDVQREKEQAIEDYPGGRNAVIRDCSLRGIMRNQQICQNYADPEAARAEGKRVQAEIDERYEAEMKGGRAALAAMDAAAFADAVKNVPQKTDAAPSIS